MLETQFLIWLHLLALAGYFGAQLALIYMLLPAAARISDEPTRRAALIAGFRFYNPFSIAMLGVLVMTGAVHLTDLKAAMKMDYFVRVAPALSLKLLLAFVVIFLQTYITFGLAFRIGRQEEIAAHGDGEPFTVEQVNRMLRRIRSMTWVTIVLTAAIVLVSIRMSAAAGVSRPSSTLSTRGGRRDCQPAPVCGYYAA